MIRAETFGCGQAAKQLSFPKQFRYVALPIIENVFCYPMREEFSTMDFSLGFILRCRCYASEMPNRLRVAVSGFLARLSLDPIVCDVTAHVATE
jgi:hypothetical protein